MRSRLVGGLACLVFSLCALSCGIANAHFLWVYSEDGKVLVVFGEGTEPDQAEFLGGLTAMQTFTTIDGEHREIKFVKKEEDDFGWFEIAASEVGSVVEVACPYGVFGRGDRTMFLDYSAKHVSLELSNAEPSKPSGKLNLDVVPYFAEGQLKLATFYKGLPIANVEIQVTAMESDAVELRSDETGVANVATPTRYIIRAKHVEPESGEVDGKKFGERRFYCTLVLDVVNSQSADTEPAAASTLEKNDESKTEAAKAAVPSRFSVEQVESDFAEFPRGMTSFGATVANNQIYVMGGKSGRAHRYAKSYQNRDVFCLALDGSNNEWQTVAENRGLQGLAVVEHNGKVYRIGGLEAQNKEGEEHDLHSVNDFLEFDPSTKQWKALPSLPEGRSSFDACVVGDQVFVVGGWEMNGDDDSQWANSMLRFDLSKPSGRWQVIEAPFRTRALAVCGHDNKIVVVGGIQESGGPTNAVHLFNLESGEWSKGPELPTEGRMKAFGCSAVQMGTHCLASTYDGGVFRLSDDAREWDKIYQLDEGRFFHQMLPIAEDRFALVGGSHMEYGSQNEVAVFEISEKQ